MMQTSWPWRHTSFRLNYSDFTVVYNSAVGKAGTSKGLVLYAVFYDPWNTWRVYVYTELHKFLKSLVAMPSERPGACSHHRRHLCFALMVYCFAHARCFCLVCARGRSAYINQPARRTTQRNSSGCAEASAELPNGWGEKICLWFVAGVDHTHSLLLCTSHRNGVITTVKQTTTSDML